MNTRLRFLRNLLFVIMCGWSLLSLINVVLDTRSEQGGTDFHSYWFYGQYVRQGIEPYSAYFDNLEPDFDITYIVGPPTTLQELRENSVSHALARVPANTAPILLLITSLSFITWEIAKFVWLGISLVCVLLTPWLARLYIESAGLKIKTPYAVFLALSFWGMLALRIGVANGQTTAVVLLLMLSALLFHHRGHRMAAGIAFGIALSKYSMGLPLLVLFLLWREYRIIAYAVATQVAGLLLLALISATSPITILQAYTDMALKHANEPGIHLAAYLPQSTALSVSIALLGVGLMIAIYVLMMRRKQLLKPTTRLLTPVFQASIFFTISLLMNYHRRYDATMTLLPIGLLFLAIAHAELFALDQRRLILLMALLTMIVVIQNSPGTAFSIVLPDSMMQTWIDFLRLLQTVAVLVLFLVNLWLFNRLAAAPIPSRSTISD